MLTEYFFYPTNNIRSTSEDRRVLGLLDPDKINKVFIEELLLLIAVTVAYRATHFYDMKLLGILIIFYRI